MKISKAEAAICLLAAVFLAFTAGWFLRGEQSAGPLLVELHHAVNETVSPCFPSVPVISPSHVSTPPLNPVPADPVKSAGKIDLNTATLEELESLPGIGEKRAASILADREKNGPFSSVEDLIRVSGIGKATLEKLKDYITVSEEYS